MILPAVMFVLVVLAVTVVGFEKPDKISSKQVKATDVLKSWNVKGKAYKDFTSYIKKVTKKGSKNYIPVKDRIAVFDMDGTLISETTPFYVEWMMFFYRVLEDKDYKAPKEIYDFVKDVAAPAAYAGTVTDEIDAKFSIYQAKVYEGMTIAEYRDFVLEFLKQPVKGHKNMTYEQSFYQPMKEVVTYLKKNNFTVYVVSGADRETCRTAVHKALGIEENHVIGSDSRWDASRQGEKNGQSYTMSTDEDVVRGSLVIKNLSMNKVSAIVREIGKQPVLAFGNSGGDTSMGVYTTSKNPYPSKAFMLMCDDLKRDFGDQEKADKMKEMTKNYGWTAISMKNDFKTIYGKKVVRYANKPEFKMPTDNTVKPAA